MVKTPKTDSLVTWLNYQFWIRLSVGDQVETFENYVIETSTALHAFASPDGEDMVSLIDTDAQFESHITLYMNPVKRICVFEHSVITNFNCACPAIQRGQGSGFLSEGSS